jgi:hypothetical protein
LQNEESIGPGRIDLHLILSIALLGKSHIEQLVMDWAPGYFNAVLLLYGCRVWFGCRDDRRWLISACAWCLCGNGRERTERFPRLIVNFFIKTPFVAVLGHKLIEKKLPPAREDLDKVGQNPQDVKVDLNGCRWRNGLRLLYTRDLDQRCHKSPLSLTEPRA